MRISEARAYLELLEREHGDVDLDSISWQTAGRLTEIQGSPADGVVVVRRFEDAPPFAPELVTDRPPHEWVLHPDDQG